MTKVIGFAGFSGSGKTTLIARLTPMFEARGVRVAVIKHDAHGHYKEVEGTDSAQLYGAGASAVVVVSPGEVRFRERGESRLDSVLERLEIRYDLVFVEGFKYGSHDKIAVFRTPEQAGILKELPVPPVAWVTTDLAVIGQAPGGIPVFPADDAEGIARFVAERCGLRGF